MILLSAMDAHDTGALHFLDAMPKRQEANPAPRRRLGCRGSSRQVQPCSSGGAGQGCSATIRAGAGPLEAAGPQRDGAILNARFLSAVAALNNSYL